MARSNWKFDAYDTDTNELILEHVDSETMCEWILDEFSAGTSKKVFKVAQMAYNAIRDCALTQEIWEMAVKNLHVDFQMCVQF